MESRERTTLQQQRRNSPQAQVNNGFFFIEDDAEAEEMQMTQEWLRIQQRRMIQSRSQPQIRLVTYRTLRPYAFGQNLGGQIAIPQEHEYEYVYQRPYRSDEDPVLSTGKLCKYFFTQMCVTTLVLIVFEAQTSDPYLQKIETFLIYMCLILVVDLLYFLFKSGTNSHSDSDNFANEAQRTSCGDLILNTISVLIYLTMIGWLFYGNYLYFTLPANHHYLDDTAVTDQKSASKVTISDFNSEKWLYVSLMCVLTVGYIQLICFFSMVFGFLIYFISKCVLSEEDHLLRFSHLSPQRMWKMIDEGLFSLLDEIDEAFSDQDFEERETRSIAERRLACDKLSEKAYEKVRKDTFTRISQGIVAGNLRSFQSPNNMPGQPSPANLSLDQNELYDEEKSGHRSLTPNQRSRFGFLKFKNKIQPTRDDAFLAANISSLNETDQMEQPRRNSIDYVANTCNDETEDYRLYRQKLREETTHQQECAICQEDFEDASIVCQLPCHIKHIFHAKCVKAWILRQNSCPLCKEKIPVPEDQLPPAHVHERNDIAWIYADSGQYL